MSCDTIIQGKQWNMETGKNWLDNQRRYKFQFEMLLDIISSSNDEKNEFTVYQQMFEHINVLGSVYMVDHMQEL